MRVRFRFEMGISVVTLLLAVITAAWQNWIEIVFRVDPDHGSGSLEWAIVIGCVVLCVVSSLVALGEWRKARLLSGASSAIAGNV